VYPPPSERSARPGRASIHVSVPSVKVLISAYACSPNRGSEPGVGWNVALEASRYHSVWVLTSSENQEAIETQLASAPNDRLRFVFIGPGGWTPSKRVRRKAVPWLANVHYYAWQVAAYFVARRLHRRIAFDVAHHVTFVRYYSPSFLSQLGLPFLWGPVGGGETAPVSYWPGFGVRGVVYELLRLAARRVGEWDPFVRATARRSVLARATTPETAERLQVIGARRVEVLLQVGLPESDLAAGPGRVAADVGPPFFASVARLVHWKGFHLGLQAFAKADLRGVDYRIVGSGPERSRLEDLAVALNIADRVRFVGELSRDELFEVLRSCIGLIHPSLHDSGGTVCLEAMAVGRPVVCLEQGGPPQLVDGETGFVVRAPGPRQAVAGIAGAMRALAGDPDLAARLGARARERAAEFSWARRGARLAETYQWLSARTAGP
jgi:glycosyltransferase involved in cell wall biosynthesis